jgi:hypothetical protein
MIPGPHPAYFVASSSILFNGGQAGVFGICAAYSTGNVSANTPRWQQKSSAAKVTTCR